MPPLSRRSFIRSLLTPLILSVLPPAARAELEEGQDWRLINPPQPPEIPGRIEVLEFFSYGCPHCATLNPLLKQWQTTLPSDVRLQRVPVTFGRQTWANLARLFYTLEVMGELERLDQQVFTALHEQRLRLYQEPALTEWIGSQGVDAARFKEIFGSFDIHAKVGRGDYLAERYQVDAVPTLTVAGRYAVLGRRARGMADLLAIADQLIERARQEAGGGAA